MGKDGPGRRGDATGRNRAKKRTRRPRDKETGKEETPLLPFPKSLADRFPRHPTAATIAAAFIGMTFLSIGCNGVNKAQGDPLFGNVKPQPGLNSTAAPAAPAVPPIPGPTSTGSTAALAAVNPRPIDGSHDLRITDSGQPGIGTASPVASAPGAGTQLQQPVAGFTPVSRQPVVGVNPAADAARLANSNLTYEGAQAQLTARGVTWQRLESWGDQGDWKFTCSVPNKQNPYISRTYEAEAHDPLSAVRGVLDQLDHDQR
jgi:hypothetical protein